MNMHARTQVYAYLNFTVQEDHLNSPVSPQAPRLRNSDYVLKGQRCFVAGKQREERGGGGTETSL